MASRPEVVFIGNGPVAAKSLELLLQHTSVEAVITKPRPPHHKGPVPMLEIAERHKLPCYTVASKRELTDLVTTHNFISPVAVLIDFGIIVDRQTIDSFSMGIINSHFSLLPALRGADPITFAILDGCEKTGVSLMCIDEGMDTGKLITRRALTVAKNETSITLTDRLIKLSDELLKEFLPRYLCEEIRPRRQPHPDRATYSRKLIKQDGVIDWSEPADLIERKIRALQPWPRCKTMLGTVPIIITAAHATPPLPNHPVGVISVNTSEAQLLVATGRGMLSIDRLQPVGKKEMSIESFLRGYADRIAPR